MLSVPDSSTPEHLAKSLSHMLMCSPQFIAIIGYTFGLDPQRNLHDDWRSLAAFKHAFRHYTGNIYIVDPRPDYLRDMLADGIEYRIASLEFLPTGNLGPRIYGGDTPPKFRTIFELYLRTNS